MPSLSVAIILISVLNLSPPPNATAPQNPTQTPSCPARADLKPGTKFIRTYSLLKDWRDQPMTYHVNLPPDFRMDIKYPILFEWHGKGGGPGTYLFPGVYHLTGHIHVGLTYPQGCRQGTAMLYATKEYVAFIRYVYDDVVAHFNGNPDYVFIGGFSAGGFMATGPGISLMIRSGLRDRLAGVVAGGCNWMCNPKYAKGVNILLWYADNDSNSYDLPNRLPEIRKYADSITTILHKGAGHSCDNSFEGPAIRRFFALHGPDKEDFKILHNIEDEKKWLENMELCLRIAVKHNTASVLAQQLLDKGLEQLEHNIRQLIRNNSQRDSLTRLYALLARYFDVPPAVDLIKNAIQAISASP